MLIFSSHHPFARHYQLSNEALQLSNEALQLSNEALFWPRLLPILPSCPVISDYGESCERLQSTFLAFLDRWRCAPS
jgi:hypothetical protein